MTSEIISVICGGPGPVLPVGTDVAPGLAYRQILNQDNRFTPCECYQQGFVYSCWDVLIYMHDDIAIYDPDWHPKVMQLFESNPDCVCVGLGGATELGREGLYKRPYRISDMARGGYASNQRDWAVHGSRITGSYRVAVVDAFFMAVRSDFITNSGGWPVNHLSHHCLDLWVACEAARQGKQVWAIGLDCHHFGGGTSTKPIYANAKWLQGSDIGIGGLVSEHELPHHWLYESYRDVLPIRVPR